MKLVHEFKALSTGKKVMAIVLVLMVLGLAKNMVFGTTEYNKGPYVPPKPSAELQQFIDDSPLSRHVQLLQEKEDAKKQKKH